MQEQYDLVIDDCTACLEINPTYTKVPSHQDFIEPLLILWTEWLHFVQNLYQPTKCDCEIRSYTRNHCHNASDKLHTSCQEWGWEVHPLMMIVLLLGLKLYTTDLSNMSWLGRPCCGALKPMRKQKAWKTQTKARAYFYRILPCDHKLFSPNAHEYRIQSWVNIVISQISRRWSSWSPATH